MSAKKDDTEATTKSAGRSKKAASSKKAPAKAAKAAAPKAAAKKKPAQKAPGKKAGRQGAAKGYISRATLRGIHLAPRKARLVVDLIRGRKVGIALSTLEFCDKKTAPLVKKLLLSAVANAKQQSAIDVDELVVKSAWVTEGKMLKRFMPRAQGRATPIRKRYSQITLVLDEIGA